MNAPAPGWHPDPTARHDYRYWDGWQWTDDVSDGAVTAFDPLPATEPHDRYDGYDGHGPRGYDGYQGYDGRSRYDRYSGYDGYDGYDSYGGNGYDGEPYDPLGPRYPYPTDDETPAKKRRSARLLVGLGLVTVALIAGLAFVLVSGGKDQPGDGTEISDNERAAGGSTRAGDTTTSSETTATTAPSNQPGGSGSTTTGPGGPGGGSTGSGGATTTTTGDQAPSPGPSVDTSSDEAMIDSLADMYQQSSGGQISDEQSRCMAEGMVEILGADGVRAMTGGGGTPPAMTQEDYTALQQLSAECGVA